MSFHRLLCSALALVFAVAAGAVFADRAEAAEGFASWYAPENAGEFTAVHATLPAGTQLTVSRGDRWVQVAVVERDHDLGGRDLDLSRAPAEFLGLTRLGAATVSYTYPNETAAAPVDTQVADTGATYAPTYETQAGYEAAYAAPQAYYDHPVGYVEPYQETYARQTWTEPAPQPDTTYQPEVATYAEPAQPAATETPAWNETTYEATYTAPVETQPASGAETYAAEAYEEPYTGAYPEQPVAEQPVAEPQVAGSGYTPGYEGAMWYPASDYGNYTAANRPESHPIDKIVVHTTQGSYESAMNWFQDPASGVSAHYTVRSADGLVGQSVSEQNIAHHAGNWDYNQTSVGIEHEGYVEDPSWYTDEMYRSSAQLGAHLVNTYGIPVDRQHIIGHDEVPGATHTDPGPYWDWDLYMGYVQEYSGQGYADPYNQGAVW